MQLQAGDKLVAMGTLNDNVVLLLKADFLTKILGKIEQGQNELKRFLKEISNSKINEET
jgi:hypothetical protein